MKIELPPSDTEHVKNVLKIYEECNNKILDYYGGISKDLIHEKFTSIMKGLNKHFVDGGKEDNEFLEGAFINISSLHTSIFSKESEENKLKYKHPTDLEIFEHMLKKTKSEKKEEKTDEQVK